MELYQRNIKLHLKSNMDRFIGSCRYLHRQLAKNLKSNMDRFIDLMYYYRQTDNKYLKSNMDRFIVHCSSVYPLILTLFKIQYG